MGTFRYALRDTFRMLTRHWGLSLLTLITATALFFLVGASALFSVNFNSIVTKIEGDLVVNAFVQKGEDVNGVVKRLSGISGVSRIRTVTPAEALEKLKAKLGNQARAVTLLGKNPLPWSIEIRVESVTDITPLVRELATIPQINDVVYAGRLADRLSRISRMASRVSLIILVMAIAVSTLVLYNTIRIAIYSRREEISVMLLVGATSLYVALPFVLQGMFLGAFGSGVAVLLLRGIYYSIVESLTVSLPFLSMLRDSRILSHLYLILFGTGITVGWLCSWFAADRYIRLAGRPK